MKDYVFADLALQLKNTWNSKISAADLISTLLSSLTEQTYPLTMSKDIASLYMTSKRDISDEIRELATVPAKRKAMPEWFSKNILPHLQEGEKTELLLQSVRQSLKEADNLSLGTVNFILNEFAAQPAELLARTFLLLLSVDNRRREAAPAPILPVNVPGRDDMPYMEYCLSIYENFGCIRTLVSMDYSQQFNDIYVCNNIRRAGSCNKKSGSVDTATGELIENCTVKTLMSISHFIILRGTGGLGKTMMLRHLLMDALHDFEEEKGLIPLYAPLRNYCDAGTSLAEDLYSILCKSTQTVSFDQFEDSLKKGYFLLLLDGLDEVSLTAYQRMEKKLLDFISQYSKNCFVLTSRPISDFLSFNRFEVMELQPLTKAQAIEMIQRLDYQSYFPGAKEEFIQQLDEKLYDSNKSFAGNPLLLGLMLMTHDYYGRIPHKMSKFFDVALEAMSDRHDKSKGAWQRTYHSGMMLDKLERVFAEICARSYLSEKFQLTEQDLQKIAARLASTTALREPAGLENYMYDICNGICLMYKEHDTYYFLHRSFQEYFTARYLAASTDESLPLIAQKLEQKERAVYDAVFGMMYEMIPDKMKRFVFLPAMHKLSAADAFASARLGEASADSTGDAALPGPNLQAFMLKCAAEDWREAKKEQGIQADVLPDDRELMAWYQRTLEGIFEQQTLMDDFFDLISH